MAMVHEKLYMSDGLENINFSEYLEVFKANELYGTGQATGGYDLYYSQIKNEVWSKPVNFGGSVNTEFDEYRPVTLLQHGFENNLMIFL